MLFKRGLCGVGVVVAVLLAVVRCAAGAEDAYNAAIREDWLRQEGRLGREAGSVEAINALIGRTRKLVSNLERQQGGADISAEIGELEELYPKALAGNPTEDARVGLYYEIRSLNRAIALKNRLIGSEPIVFMKRRRFICQMLHEYLGYYYDYADIAGGGVYILKRPGESFETVDLTGGKFPKGNFSTLSMSYDAKRLYFAFAARSEKKKTDFFSDERSCFHIWSMNVDGSDAKQLTHGRQDYFDPCVLPNGDIVMMCTRRGGYTRCNNPWEPTPSHTLHRMKADGTEVRTLSYHETSEWHPSVLGDGRIVYIRWDYVDRSAANFHGLWVSNPDGTNASSLWGNYTHHINACYQPKAIPGSNRIVFIAGAHHADVGGSLVIVDPEKVQLDDKTGEDRFEAIEQLTPEVCYPESTGWPKSYFHSPWPLSEDYFLVSFSFDPLPGMSSGEGRDTETGIYYFDRFGNMELLFREKGISSMYPIPLMRREKPPVIPEVTEPEEAAEEMGEFIVSDVNQSLLGLPAGRRITHLRVYQVLPKERTHIANVPRIGHPNADSARMLLGTVPVESDGSAYFRVPARKPVYFQAVDAEGRAVQSMRSVAYLQPGERRGCVGCHEPSGQTPGYGGGRLLALMRAPNEIVPGPEGTRPFNFATLVQPVLDRHCVSCHDGKEGANKSGVVLSGEPTETFNRAYESLGPYVRWYEWGGNSIAQTVSIPGRIGADESPLMGILADKNHRESVRLSDEERRRMYIWLDGNVPFYGHYREQARLAQRQGQDVPPPAMQ
jgi:hypothetical protein